MKFIIFIFIGFCSWAFLNGIIWIIMFLLGLNFDIWVSTLIWIVYMIIRNTIFKDKKLKIVKTILLLIIITLIILFLMRRL